MKCVTVTPLHPTMLDNKDYFNSEGHHFNSVLPKKMIEKQPHKLLVGFALLGRNE